MFIILVNLRRVAPEINLKCPWKLSVPVNLFRKTASLLTCCRTHISWPCLSCCLFLYFLQNLVSRYFDWGLAIGATWLRVRSEWRYSALLVTCLHECWYGFTTANKLEKLFLTCSRSGIMSFSFICLLCIIRVFNTASGLLTTKTEAFTTCVHKARVLDERGRKNKR